MPAKNCFNILTYHRIGPENSFDGFTISEKIFTEQMWFIRRHCRPMSLGEIVQRILERKVIPPRTMAVTFDDGYADTFKIAFPILKCAKIPAAIFVTTGYIDRKVASHQNAPMMTWGMIKEMQQSGIEIGAHTISHPNLAQCSLREVKCQMIGSRDRLEKKLRAPVRLFSYPFGGVRSFNKGIQSSARQAGFLAACTTVPGSNSLDTDLYALRRLSPIRDEIHRMLIELDQAPQKKSLKGKSAIQGVSAKAMQIWSGRYKRVKQRLARKTPNHWRMKRLSGT